MTEAERLQKIILAQDRELRRMRRLLSVARIAHAEFGFEDDKLMVTVSAIGVDEYHFIEQARSQLEIIAKKLVPEAKTMGDIKDSITGEDIIGGVSPA